MNTDIIIDDLMKIESLWMDHYMIEIDLIKIGLIRIDATKIELIKKVLICFEIMKQPEVYSMNLDLMKIELMFVGLM
jgi:hypothetical protein